LSCPPTGSAFGRPDDKLQRASSNRRRTAHTHDALHIEIETRDKLGRAAARDQQGPVEDIHNVTAITYPQAYRTTMTGTRLKDVLEDVADNLFNPDPYYQQGGDVVRCGGIGYTIDVGAAAGRRISNMTLLKTGETIAAQREYTIAGWASVNEGTEGPPMWDVVERYIARKGTVRAEPASAVKVVGG
jgi:2',3'-cyclic-nucleotide 2'-phosphodiesterase (5'-nucleotidase family)